MWGDFLPLGTIGLNVDRVFSNVLTGGTFAPVGPYACHSSEEKVSPFAPVA